MIYMAYDEKIPLGVSVAARLATLGDGEVVDSAVVTPDSGFTVASQVDQNTGVTVVGNPTTQTTASVGNVYDIRFVMTTTPSAYVIVHVLQVEITDGG